MNLSRLAKRFPRIVLLLTLLATAVAALGIARLETKLDPYEDRDPSLTSNRALALEQDQFGDLNQAVFIFKRQDERDLSLKEVCGIVQWAHKLSLSQEGIKSWSSPESLRQAHKETNRLLFPKLFGNRCDQSALPDRSWTQEWKQFSASPWNKILVGPTPNDFMVQFVFNEEENVNSADQALEAAQSYAKQNSLTVYFLGSTSFPVYLKRAMAKDAYIPLLLVLLFCLFFRLTLGTFRASFVYLFTLGLNFIFLFGLMGIFGLPINALTNSLSLITAIAGLEDFLFLSALQGDIGFTEGEEFESLYAPAFFTSLSTLIGFWSLYFTRVSVIREFGLAAGLSAILEWISLFLILPALLQLMPKGNGRSWHLRNKAWIHPSTPKASERAPSWCFRIFTLTLFLAGILAFQFLNFDDDAANNFAPSHLATESYHWIKSQRGWQSSVNLLFEPNADMSSALVEMKAVSGLVALDDWEQAFAWFTQGVNLEDKNLARRELTGSDWEASYNSKDGYHRVRAYLDTDRLSQLRPVLDQLKKICTRYGCLVSGKSASYLEVSDQVVPSLINSFILSLVLVAILLFLIAKYLGVKNYLALLFSALWGPLVLMVPLALLQIKINIVTSLFAAIVVGLAGDNAIQYIFAARKGDLRDGMNRLSKASIALTCLLVMSSLLFLLQTPLALKTLGYLFAAAFVLNYWGDFFVLAEWIKTKIDNHRQSTVK